MNKIGLFWGIILCFCLPITAQTFSRNGKVIDRKTRQGIPYANVYIEGNTSTGTVTDSIGRFRITNAKPGIHRLVVSCIGYKERLTPEYMVSARTTYLFSIRQSYLQFLFDLLGMPFLPNYIDAQFKVKSRLTDKHEVMLLAWEASTG